MGGAQEDMSRKLIYPVTMGQKLKYMNFPRLLKTSSTFRNHFYAYITLIPVFYLFDNLIHSDFNRNAEKKFREMQKKEREEHLIHLEGFSQH